jgi:transcriptional regulator with XRE-family HTH domain
MTSIDRHIGRRTLGKRRALNLTQDDLAKKLVVSGDTIEAYERGTVRVPAEHLLKLSKFLGISFPWVLSPTESQNQQANRRFLLGATRV